MDINQFAVYQLKTGRRRDRCVSGLMKNCSKAGFGAVRILQGGVSWQNAAAGYSPKT